MDTSANWILVLRFCPCSGVQSSKMTSLCFRDLIGGWTSIAQFARDMGAPYQRAIGWHKRDIIPSRHWTKLIAVLAERGIDVSVGQLLAMADERKAK